MIKMKKSNYKLIIFLAYADRYVYPTVLLLTIIVGEKETFLLSGIGYIILSIYEFVGYVCKWKHIFCSFQNARHQKMTPDNIVWGSVKKSDAYVSSILLCILGVLLIILSIFLD